MALAIDIVPVLTDNFAYVLRNEGKATVIDPGEAPPIQSFLDTGRLKLELILCTHHHPDHVGGAVELAKKNSCPIWVPALDLSRITGSKRGLQDGETETVAGEKMQVLHVPGHTHGQVAFYFPDSGALFTGDTLFSLGCGRLFEGTPAEMFSSLEKIARLPDDTRIYFGHEYTLRNGDFARQILEEPESTALLQYLAEVEKRLNEHQPSSPARLGLEKKINPFLNAGNLEEWTRRRELRNRF